MQFHIAEVTTTSRSVAVRCGDGRVLVWGEGSSGELGLGPRRTSASKPSLLPDVLAHSIAGGQHTLCAVTLDRQLCITGGLCGGTRSSLRLVKPHPCSQPGGGPSPSPGHSMAGSSTTAFAFPAVVSTAAAGTTVVASTVRGAGEPHGECCCDHLVPGCALTRPVLAPRREIPGTLVMLVQVHKRPMA